MSRYLPILRQLQGAKSPFIIIGTYALKYCYPDKMHDYAVSDCDLVIPDDLATIRTAIRVLRQAKWETTLWQETIDEEVQAASLSGKYYIRAKKEDLIIDLTFESPFISFEQLFERHQVQRGLICASLDDILYLKRIKGRAIDFAVCKRFFKF